MIEHRKIKKINVLQFILMSIIESLEQNPERKGSPIIEKIENNIENIGTAGSSEMLNLRIS